MTRIWNLLCSLKLAIALASLATVAIMIGSLSMPGNAQLFAQLDTLILGEWLKGPGAEQATLSWWVYLSCATIVLFGINTLCCFIDWLLNIRNRWRKSGEYLLHLGFCLVLGAYIWGSVSGSRAHELALPLGETRALPGATGYYLHLESFEPQIDPSGRPMDFPQRLTLSRGDSPLTTQEVRLNHPLLWNDMVVIPSSFRQKVLGFELSSPQQKNSIWKPGHLIELADGSKLRVIDFYPHVVRQTDGRIRPFGEQFGNPAFLLQIEQKEMPHRRVWYLLREGIPELLYGAGLNFRPFRPVTEPVSLLTISYDPGAPLAAAGGVLMALGVCVAMFSYYAKRRRGEHPEID